MEDPPPAHHIVMFPYMAQGHIIPFLALARLIEKRSPSCTITLVNTPLNIRKLQSSLPPDSSIRLHSLPFTSSDHGLPPDTENTDGLPFPYFVKLFHASLSLRPAFEQFLSGLISSARNTPLCIISDVLFGWTAEVARAHGVRHATFTTCGGYGTAGYFSLWLNLPHARTDADEFHIPGFPESVRINRSQLSAYLRPANGSDPWSTFFQEQISLSLDTEAMLCNTVEEIDPIGVATLRKMAKSPVYCIGHLLPASFLHSDQTTSPPADTFVNRSHKKLGIPVPECIEWLNLHPPSSVLFISFGSQNTIAANQMMELAKGLENSGQPFMWVIRPPFGNDINGEHKAEWLPPGFEERIRNRKQGILVRRWGPQLEILRHSSTGAFLSHCGWNSTLESLSQGVPIIGWPLAAEQFYNSKMMEEEMGVCVEVARGITGEVTNERVETVIRLVMGGTDKGVEMRKKAEGIAGLMRDSIREVEGRRGSSLQALDNFLQTARRECNGQI